MTVTFQGNYKGAVSATKTFQIKKKNLNKTVVLAASPKSSKKNGNFAAKITVLDTNRKKLMAGSDYYMNIIYLDEDGNELRSKDIVDEGTMVTAVITGKNNYTGTAEFTYMVTSAGIDLSRTIIKAPDKECT